MMGDIQNMNALVGVNNVGVTHKAMPSQTGDVSNKSQAKDSDNDASLLKMKEDGHNDYLLDKKVSQAIRQSKRKRRGARKSWSCQELNGVCGKRRAANNTQSHVPLCTSKVKKAGSVSSRSTYRQEDKHARYGNQHEENGVQELLSSIPASELSKKHGNLRHSRETTLERSNEKQNYVPITKSNQERVIPCPACSESTPMEHYVNHILCHFTPVEDSDTPSLNSMCKICQTIVASKKAENHLKQKHGAHDKKHKICQICGALIPTSNFSRHMKTFHCTRKHVKCEICKQQVVQSYLNQHTKKVHGQQVFSCPTPGCQITSKYKWTIDNHLKTVHVGNSNKHPCPICKKEFKLPKYLKQHLQTIHSRLVTFSCKFCGKQFNKKDHLKKHELVHTGEKPHLCTVCGKRFSVKSNLTSHKLYLHATDQKPIFNCLQCSKVYVRKQSLKLHVKQVHELHSPNCDEDEQEQCVDPKPGESMLDSDQDKAAEEDDDAPAQAHSFESQPPCITFQESGQSAREPAIDSTAHNNSRDTSNRAREEFLYVIIQDAQK